MADFPDLNDDGKITRADVLKGRGVFKRGGKVKKFDMGGETSDKEPGGVAYLKQMAARYAERPSKLDQLRSDIKATGRAGMDAAKESIGATPLVSGMRIGARGIKNMAKDMPKSYDQEMGMKKGGVAKKVTKEMEYDYKTGKKSFKGTTQQRDAHAEKEGKKVAKHLAYDMGMKKGGKVSSASKRADGCAVRGKTRI